MALVLLGPMVDMLPHFICVEVSSLMEIIFHCSYQARVVGCDLYSLECFTAFCSYNNMNSDNVW